LIPVAGSDRVGIEPSGVARYTSRFRAAPKAASATSTDTHTQRGSETFGIGRSVKATNTQTMNQATTNGTMAVQRAL